MDENTNMEFDRQAATERLAAAGYARADLAMMKDGQLVDAISAIEKGIAPATATVKATDTAIHGGDVAAIDQPEQDLIGELVTLTHGHMPDITPAQARAFGVMAAGYTAAVGVPMNHTAELAVAIGATLFPLAWVAADAVIRYGRAKHIFGART